MKTVQASELREHIDEYLDAMKNGETVAILEGEKPIGALKPQETDEEQLDRLERKESSGAERANCRLIS